MESHYYKDKVCLIIGAASGIGLATTKLLIKEGAIIYTLDKKKMSLPNVNAIYCDLENKNSIDDAFKQLPQEIDSVFGIAGLSGIKTDYLTTFTVNFLSYKYMTDTYLKTRMKKHGSICYVTSTSGKHWAKYAREYKAIMKAETWEKTISILKKKNNLDTPGIIAYPLSKRALNYFAAMKALEYADRDIRVNTIQPATCDTPMLEEFHVNTYGELISQTGAIQRFARPEEIAKPMLFLNSDMASFISGICLKIDYGNEAMIKLGKKRDPFDIKIGSKLFQVGLMQKERKKEKNYQEEEIEII
ncbi:MAG: SDR family oxidoreductase [Bacilli bacterium]|nr:SDR family oxidoreductase [Bacilli bacterium]